MLSTIKSVFRPFGFIPEPAPESLDQITTTVINEPELVTIPLEYPGQVLYKPLVKSGECVRRNQIIGRSELGNCIHASISGKMLELKAIWTTRGYHVPAIVIEQNGNPPLSSTEMFQQSKISSEGISPVDLLKTCGVISPWTMPGKYHREEDIQSFPDIEHLVIKGVNEDPTIVVNEQTLKNEFPLLTDGFSLLEELAPKAKRWLTVPNRMKELIKSQFSKQVRVVGMSTEYGGRIERLVVHRLTGKNIPNTAPYRALGIAVISVEYLLALTRALQSRLPFVDKFMSVYGSDIKKPLLVNFPIGTPIHEVLKQFGKSKFSRILIGGPMKGQAQYTDKTPLTKSSHGLYLMKQDELPLEVNLTCTNCGRCTRICPINLQVHLIGRFIEYDMVEEARRLHPEACLECGLCAYVCPAHRPLVQLVRMCNQNFGGDDRNG